MHAYLLLALAFVVLFAHKKYLEYRKVIDSIHNYPGLRYAIGFQSPIFPYRIPYLAAGSWSIWSRKHEDFVQHNADVISSVRLFPKTTINYLIADADVLKEVTNSRARFPKPLEQYRILTFYGSNIVVTEHDEWKRHRKVAAPSFSERNNRLVWDETVSIVKELSEIVWAGKDEIVIDNIVDLTVPIALFVIGVAGFGRRVSWIEDLTVPPGHTMPFKDALHIVSNDLWIKVVFPNWFLKYSPFKRISQFHAAYIDLGKYMNEMVQNRKTSEKKEERYDLMSSLLDANEEEADGLVKLSDSELIGNIFIFLIAGHETTAHTLAFTFILLALFQDEQEKLYQHIKNIIPDDRLPAFEEMGKLTYCLAVFNETLRMFPPVNVIPKYAAEDCTLVTRTMSGEPVSVPCPKGTALAFHTPGLHYNPRYWDDPYAFKPERFLGDWPRDAFLPFSGGARSCLGRRFTETEAVAVLAYIVAQYTIHVKDEPEFAHETFEQRKERLLRSKSAITLYPVKAPLVFRRRQPSEKTGVDVV